MHRMILLAAVAALGACSQADVTEADETTEVAADENVAADANAAAAANVVQSTASSLNETTWTYTEDGKPTQTTIDANGGYVTTSGTEHVDHGTVTYAQGKACFTSAMNQDGPECWTIQDTAIGASMESTSDKGNKLTVTRVAYVAPAPAPAAQ